MDYYLGLVPILVYTDEVSLSSSYCRCESYNLSTGLKDLIIFCYNNEYYEKRGMPSYGAAIDFDI